MESVMTQLYSLVYYRIVNVCSYGWYDILNWENDYAKVQENGYYVDWENHIEAQTNDNTVGFLHIGKGESNYC